MTDVPQMSDEMTDLINKLEVILAEYEAKGEDVTVDEMQEMLAKMRMLESDVKDPEVKKELSEGIAEFQQMIAEHS